MNDYSDLIFLMGAMIIFSLLSVQTSRMFQMNDKVQMEAEIEYNAVSIAQNEIDQIRWIQTEAMFTGHKNTYPKEIPMIVDDGTLLYNVDMEATDVTIPGSNVNSKKVIVTVTNEFLQNNNSGVQLQFIKSFN